MFSLARRSSAASGGGVQWGTASAVMMLGALPPAFLGLLMYRQISRLDGRGAVKGDRDEP